VNLQSASHNSGAWSNDETIDFTWIAPVSDHDVTEVGLGFNASRYYKVRAYAASLDDDTDSSNGTNGWSTLSAAVSQGATMAEVPQAPTVTGGYSESLGFYADVVGFEPVGGVANYTNLEIQETTGGNGGSDMAASTNTSFQDTGLIGGTNYSYRVRALNQFNQPTAWTSPGTGTTPPDASGVAMSHIAISIARTV